MPEVEEYIDSWKEFETACENKAKGRCILNSKSWRKLREFHMEQWLKAHPAPFGFMFKLKHRHPLIYRSIPCAPRFYHSMKLLRNSLFCDTIANKVVIFPSWKGFFRRDDEKEWV